MIVVTSEYVFINPKRNGINDIINITIQEHSEKYDNTYWNSIEYKYDIQFVDKIKNKTKNITTKRGI